MRSITLVLLFFFNAAFAQDDVKSLAKASLSFLKKNHFAKYTSLPLENDTNFRYLSSQTNQNIVNFKPVLPFTLNPSYDLIIRTIAPVYAITPLPNQQGTVRGVGDLNPTFFISPAYVNSWIFGLGPTVFMPTTSNSTYLGSNKWSAGPELAAISINENWLYGILTYNVYAAAPNSNRIKSSQFSLQYMVAYTFDNGWYISTNPEIIGNWQNDPNQKWLVPFGLGAGKAFYWGEQGINLSTHAYYNAVRPANIGPAWQLQLELEFLFPALS